MNRTTTASSIVALTAAAMLLAGCASSTPASDSSNTPTTSTGDAERLAVTYDGGIAVLDGDTLEVIAELPIEGFTRVNPVGDGRHVMVTTETGFQLLDTAAGADGEPTLTDVRFDADAAGHVVPHAGTTVLFDDATGDMTLFDTDAFLAGAEMPETETVPSLEAHHGVAIQLADGTLLSTLGDSETRTGVRALDADRQEIARAENCPGVHGEGTAADEVAVFGCEDGVLVYADGAFTKIDSPDAFGRIGNQFTTEESAIALGDYKTDPDAEGYLLSQLAFVDTAAGTLEVMPMPEGAEYTFRDLGRGPHGEALVLASDGALYVFDAETREQLAAHEVIEAWEGPAEWQDPHPALKVSGHVAYVSEPATRELHAVDVESGEVLATTTLDGVPNELAVTG